MLQLKKLSVTTSIRAENPWGLDLELEIFRDDTPAWTDFQEELVAEGNRRRIRAERATQVRVAAESRGKRQGKGGDIAERAEREAEIYLDELNLGELLKSSRYKVQMREGMARHLFRIVRCNLYGLPVADTFENRLRLLTDVRAPVSEEAAEWHGRAAGEEGFIFLPRRIPAEEGDLAAWWELLAAEGDDVERAARRWGEMGRSALVEVAHVPQGAAGAYLHDLIVEWILVEASKRAAFHRSQVEAARGFLAPGPSSTPSGGDGSGSRSGAGSSGGSVGSSSASSGGVESAAPSLPLLS